MVNEEASFAERYQASIFTNLAERRLEQVRAEDVSFAERCEAATFAMMAEKRRVEIVEDIENARNLLILLGLEDRIKFNALENVDKQISDNCC